MNEWKKYKISALIESNALVIGDGYRAKNSELSPDEGLPFARAGTINDGFQFEDAEYLAPENLHKAGEKVSQPGDVLFTSKGTVGRIAFVTETTPKFVYSPQLTWWRVLDTQRIDPEFLYCWMRGREFISQINSFSGQTDMAAYVSLKDQRQMMHITLPEIEEQKEIAASISCLDRKIENLRRQNETLEAIAQTLFKHWFVDFEFPNADGKPYKSSGGEMVLSELGEIPPGWKLLELGDVATNHSETHKFENKTQVVFINTGDVLEGNFLHREYSPVDTLPGQAKKKIKQNDILYSEIRPINSRFAYVNFSDDLDDYVVSTKFMVVRSNEKILPRFLYLLLKRDSTIQEFHYIADSRSGTFPQITFESVSKFPVVLPDIELQKQLMSVITPLLEKKEFNIQKIQTLIRTRDVLLPQLMSGKIHLIE